MLKIRLCSDNLKEVEKAKEWMEKHIPDMRFSSPRVGTNPKYINDPKWFSYGEPRTRNKKAIKVKLKNYKK